MNPEESSSTKEDVTRQVLENLIPFELFPEGAKELLFQFLSFKRELNKESDRGCSLLAASFLDCLLEDVLRIKFIGTEKHLNNLFELNGPVSTFSSRILMAYSLGILTKLQMQDLQTIRKIRNEFGHSYMIINFETDKIKSLCSNLKLITPLSHTPRERFISSVSFVAGILEFHKRTQAKFEEPEEDNLEGLQQENAAFLTLSNAEFQKLKNENSKED